MPQVNFQPVPDVAPEVDQPVNPKINVEAPAAAFGSPIAAGVEKIGQALGNIGEVWGQVQKDNAVNTAYSSVEDQVNGLLRLNGDDAVNAEGNVRSKIADAVKQGRDSLFSPMQKVQYDNETRGYIARFVNGRIDSHVNQQRHQVMRDVNTASYNNGLDMIGKEAAVSGADGSPAMDAAFNAIASAQTKAAQVEGVADQPEVVKSMQNKAIAAGVVRWAETLEAGDASKPGQGPAAAMKVVEAHKDVLIAGGVYQQIHDHLKAKADDDTADQIVNQKIKDATTRRAGGGAAVTPAAVKVGDISPQGGPYVSSNGKLYPTDKDGKIVDQPVVTPAAVTERGDINYHPAVSSGGVNTIVTPEGMSAYRARTAQIESSSGRASSNIYQFQPGTWKRLGGGDLNNRALQEERMTQLTNENRAYLRNALGREPTGAELYLAHQQGAGGAVQLLNNPSRRAGDIVGNVAISGNGGNPNAPASQFVALWNAKYNGTKAPVFTDTATTTFSGKPTRPDTTPVTPFPEIPPPTTTAPDTTLPPAPPPPVTPVSDVVTPAPQQGEDDLPGVAKARADQAALLSGVAQDILMDPNLSEAVRDKAIKRLEAVGQAAAFAEGITAQQRKAVEDEKVHNVMTFVRGGDFDSAWQTLTDGANKEQISEARFESLSRYITSITGKEHPKSYGPELQKFIDGIMAEPGAPNRVKDIDEILNGYRRYVDTGGKEGLSKTGVDEAVRIFTAHQKGEDEGVHINLDQAGKVANGYFRKGEENIPGGFVNPNAATYEAEFMRRMLADKNVYQKEHPNMEGFPYFDAKKRMEIMRDIANPQRLLKDKMESIGREEPPMDQNVLASPSPDVDKDQWDAWLTKNLPVNEATSQYMDPALYARATAKVLLNANNPQFVLDYDNTPWVKGGAPRAEDIIKEFGGKPGQAFRPSPNAPVVTPPPKGPPSFWDMLFGGGGGG